MAESPTYLMTCWFSTLSDEPSAHTPVYTSAHPDLESAEIAGMKIGCARGCQRVEVLSPDGTLQALWDMADTSLDDDGETHMSSLWQRIGDESKALGETRRDEIMQEMKTSSERNRA